MNINNVEKDFYYSKILREEGIEAVYKAGYFENDDADNCISDEELADMLKIPCVPLDFHRIKEAHNPAIVLMTGCFNPIHSGHIKAMVLAKRELVKRGYSIVASLFAPDSDKYCASKGDFFPFYERVAKIYNSEYAQQFNCTVDSFALYAGKDVNFTTIYRHLELYIKKYTGQDIPIFIVFGSDRAEYSYAFKDKAIVVHRIEKRDVHKDSIFIEQDDCYVNSSNIRSSGISLTSKRDVIFRVNLSSLKKELFENYFENIYTQNFKEVLDDKTISLDKWTESIYFLDISRLYLLGGASRGLAKYTLRNDSKFREAIKYIPAGQYYLFDDDSFTGGTFRYVENLLKNSHIKIMGTRTLVRSNIHDYEILDAHDFTIGSRAGLVCQLQNSIRRFPYVYPFVDPFIRASIVNPMQFSLDIWTSEKNKLSSSSIEIGLTSAGRGYVEIGHDPRMRFSDVCEYYENVCRKALGK